MPDDIDPANPLAPPSEESLQQIRERAYYMWLEDGCPEGREMEYWERASELQAMADHPDAGLLPNPEDPDAHVFNRPEEAALQENLGEFPDRLSDQGEHRTAPMTRAAEHAAIDADR